MNNENKAADIREYAEKTRNPVSGWLMLFVNLLLLAASIAFFVMCGIDNEKLMPFFMPAGAVCIVAFCILVQGLRIINPNEAVVMVLFGKYTGTVAQEGFFYMNPFATKKKISLKARTLINDKQKVNDERGNPVEIGVVVIWKVKNTAKAMFKVEDYVAYVTTQSDSAIRNVARQYPYDVSEEEVDEKSLRGSSSEISDVLKSELQQRVELAGIEIVEARISHLAYAPEIAAAMLQRQQAEAIVSARQKIVEGAVGMVEMALNKLSENEIVKLDDERKAQMVSNLLVVLCGNKDAQPIVNSGSLY